MFGSARRPDASLQELQKAFAVSAWRANAFGFGLVWAVAGLAWAGALGQPLAVGLIVGVSVGVLGAAVMAFRSSSALELVTSATRRSSFGGLATVAAITGSIVWLAA